MIFSVDCIGGASLSDPSNRPSTEAVGRRSPCRSCSNETPVFVGKPRGFAETVDYVPLARDVDLRSIAEGRDLATEMPLCGQMD
jgi:hypothetical protein